MLKVELHAHTADDPVDQIPHSSRELIDRAATLGYDALAITLHERWLDPTPLLSYAAERGVTLIPGVERSIEGRHVLLLNFSRASEDVNTFEDLRRLKGREAGLVVAPHAFFPSRFCVGGLLHRHPDLFDGVERNAMFTPTIDFNAPAERWAASHGKPVVGNCDVHRLYQMGTCYSLVDAPPEPSAICEAIRNRQVTVWSEPLSLARAAATMADLALAKLRLRGRGPVLQPVSERV